MLLLVRHAVGNGVTVHERFLSTEMNLRVRDQLLERNPYTAYVFAGGKIRAQHADHRGKLVVLGVEGTYTYVVLIVPRDERERRCGTLELAGIGEAEPILSRRLARVHCGVRCGEERFDRVAVLGIEGDADADPDADRQLAHHDGLGEGG